jgi:hypothetical protein
MRAMSPNAPRLAPRALRALRNHHHPLDGQRRLRPRQQRRHYSFFDTAVNRYLIEAGALDIHPAR